MLNRFTGTVAPLAPVNVAPLAAWIGAIDLRDWPQQNPPGRRLKPAMVTDLAWHGFGALTQPLVDQLMSLFGAGARERQRMLSAVLPGDKIPPHRDQQGPKWLCRVHVPLLTNSQARFVVDGRPRRMSIGVAYLVNTLSEHSVANDGSTPRIHLMFDVFSPTPALGQGAAAAS